MGLVSRGKDVKPPKLPAKSLWDSEPSESSLPMLSSSAIELIHDVPKGDVIIEDPAEESFFEVTDRSALSSPDNSSSSLSNDMLLAGVAPKKRSVLLPWLLFTLSITVMVAAWLEVVKPRFDALAEADQKLAAAARDLDSGKTEVQSLEKKVADLEGEKSALIAERDELAKEREAAAEKQKAAEDLAEQLRTALAEEKRVEVTVVDGAATLRLTTDELFVQGDVELEDPKLLAGIAAALKPHAKRTVTIASHTDSTPVPSKLRSRFPSNYELAAARAFAVLHELEKQKLDDRFEVVAAAATQPIASEKTAQGRKANRRIEILIR